MMELPAVSISPRTAHNSTMVGRHTVSRVLDGTMEALRHTLPELVRLRWCTTRQE